jgi:hypothetical protein
MTVKEPFRTKRKLYIKEAASWVVQRVASKRERLGKIVFRLRGPRRQMEAWLVPKGSPEAKEALCLRRKARQAINRYQRSSGRP